jgi:hypothetical protein
MNLCKNIVNQLSDSTEQEKFTSLLRSILAISLKRTKDPEVCLKTFVVLEKFTHKMSLQKKNISFGYGIFSVFSCDLFFQRQKPVLMNCFLTQMNLQKLQV